MGPDQKTSRTHWAAHLLPLIDFMAIGTAAASCHLAPATVCFSSAAAQCEPDSNVY